jgi:hypothetical protein
MRLFWKYITTVLPSLLVVVDERKNAKAGFVIAAKRAAVFFC